MERRLERRERAPRGGGVRRLGVVDVADAVDLGDELEPVRHAGERAQRGRDRVVADARRPRRGCRGGRVLPVVRARDQRLGRQHVVGGELDAPAAPGTGPKPRGTTATSSAVWFSKIRSLASR